MAARSRRRARYARHNVLVTGLKGFVRVAKRGLQPHATLWVEGFDRDEPSVSGIPLNREQLVSFRDQLTLVIDAWK